MVLYLESNTSVRHCSVSRLLRDAALVSRKKEILWYGWRKIRGPGPYYRDRDVKKLVEGCKCVALRADGLSKGFIALERERYGHLDMMWSRHLPRRHVFVSKQSRVGSRKHRSVIKGLGKAVWCAAT